MRVAVCDDERVFSEEVRSAVYDYSNINRLEFAVDSYRSGEDLLGSAIIYDMVLLDYRMGGINGIETAKALREKNLSCSIIFLTGYPQECVYSAFEVDTFRFLKKPLDVAQLHRALDDYFRRYGENYPLLLKVNREKIWVHTNEIVFLEADNKCCKVHLAGKTLLCAQTMASIAEMAPENIFCRVNKAFIVNLNYISKYSGGEIDFRNGEKAYCSRYYRASFREAYRKYAKDRAI